MKGLGAGPTLPGLGPLSVPQDLFNFSALPAFKGPDDITGGQTNALDAYQKASSEAAPLSAASPTPFATNSPFDLAFTGFSSFPPTAGPGQPGVAAPAPPVAGLGSFHIVPGKTENLPMMASQISNSSVLTSLPSHPYRWAKCDLCGEAMEYFPERPELLACLTCSKSHECDRSEVSISPGEAYWVCRECDRYYCEESGPRVVICETYDYLDCTSGESEVKHILSKGPDQLMHRRRKPRTRSSLPAGGSVALDVVQRARDVAESMREEVEDVFDRNWREDGSLLLHLLDASDAREAAGQLQALAFSARDLLAEQPMLVEIEAPCKVFGDVHGQLHDLLLLFNCFGMPGSRTSFVFNGDFVDRGLHQLEVIAVLLALKLAFPEYVWLIRGNHEDSVMNASYGFLAACVGHLGDQLGKLVFNGFQEVFNYLPLGCLIGGRILCVHGGLGDGLWSLDDLRRAPRPLTHEHLVAPGNEWLWNILWSDPIEEDARERESIFGVHPSPRGGKSVHFGVDITQGFCQFNQVEVVVRSHQAKMSGVGFEVMHDERLVRVFSARDYEGHGNDGAVLSIKSYNEPKRPEALLIVRAQVLRSLTKRRQEIGEPITPKRR